MTEKKNQPPAAPKVTSENKSTQLYAHAREVRDPDLISDVRTTILIQSPKGGRAIVWLTLLLFILVVAWMYTSEIEEVTRGMGKVIPSSQIQVVQNLEGGILEELHVRVGDIVKKGQLLMRLDETRFSAPYQESRLKYLALQARAARLRAETAGKEMEIPKLIFEKRPEIASREIQLYLSRKGELDATIDVLEEQVIQRKQELTELKEENRELNRTYRLLKREIDLTKPLVEQGAVSEVEVLRLEREASSMLGDIAATRLAIPRVESKLNEAKKVIREERLKFTNAAKRELNEVEVELEAMSAVETALADRLDRTAVRSPVYGTVKQVLVNTVGGVVQPGMNLVEIVPLEDTLLVETQIKPSDIAFLRPKQKAMVKFTAYDFTIYGGLEAELEQISADSIADEKGNSFYIVRVRTNKNFLDGKDGPMPIIPGMVTTVDILTGKKTILSYLLKPVLRARHMALRER
ncbi:HlyD family type I secretion periplasmic adaptor subunit [Desulfopila sp. IMCC35008]|uniref:HlyD family type I secretion periplasmic adaptor subunit n=1 Tax=Desulfopila sp. IMCC35008 TaxID=2653858 RepID=UPI0013D1DE88|nr:HlyD family type I secretion periplasmic adaptor subunit [Desulfopila sp. IMCC35008]